MNGKWFYKLLGWLIIFLVPFIIISLFYLNEKIATDNPSAPTVENGEVIPDNEDSKDDYDGDSSKDSDKDSDDKSDDNDDKKADKDSDKTYWGVDSASLTDKDMYSCVKNNFGEPDVWGRYLGDKGDVSVGLTQDEAKFLHDKDVKILVIYNHFEEAVGYDNGVSEAKQAISYAKDLEIPEDVAIFADIEPNYSVDSAFIDGWYETLDDSNYNTGIYGVFDEDSKLLEAYNATSDDTKKNTVVWTAEPQKDITTKDNAPKFAADGPDKAMLYGWQYGIEADECEIDTNLFKGDLFDYLW